jgi:hypothetical protein
MTNRKYIKYVEKKLAECTAIIKQNSRCSTASTLIPFAKGINIPIENRKRRKR